MIDLTGWPDAPTATVENGAVILQRGLSFVVLEGCDDPASIEPFLRLPKKA